MSFWEFAFIFLYVLGAIMCHSWAYADGRSGHSSVPFWVALWPILVLIGTVLGLYDKAARNWPR